MMVLNACFAVQGVDSGGRFEYVPVALSLAIPGSKSPLNQHPAQQITSTSFSL